VEQSSVAYALGDLGMTLKGVRCCLIVGVHSKTMRWVGSIRPHSGMPVPGLGVMMVIEKCHRSIHGWDWIPARVAAS